jgi:hypothetical protein
LARWSSSLQRFCAPPSWLFSFSQLPCRLLDRQLHPLQLSESLSCATSTERSTTALRCGLAEFLPEAREHRRR